MDRTPTAQLNGQYVHTRATESLVILGGLGKRRPVTSCGRIRTKRSFLPACHGRTSTSKESTASSIARKDVVAFDHHAPDQTRLRRNRRLQKPPMHRSTRWSPWCLVQNGKDGALIDRKVHWENLGVVTDDNGQPSTSVLRNSSQH